MIGIVPPQGEGSGPIVPKMLAILATACLLSVEITCSVPAMGRQLDWSGASSINHGGPSKSVQVQPIIEIANDSGGFVAEYALRLYEMLEAKQKVKFMGRCDSACTLFLALPTAQTCITEGAYFRFHAPTAPSASTAAAVGVYMMRKYPKWVRAWIVAQGGLSDRLPTMSYGYAHKFMRSCI